MDDAILDVETSTIPSKEEEEEGKNEEKASGLVQRLISRIVSPSSSRHATEIRKPEEFEVVENQTNSMQEAGEVKGEGEAEGKNEEKASGLVQRLISHKVSPSSPRHASENGKPEEFEVVENKTNSMQEAGEVKGEGEVEGNEQGDSIFKNLVSHLPTSVLPEDSAPTADEATLLIHAIVDD